MTLELLIDPSFGNRWPTDESRDLFRHLCPDRAYVHRNNGTLGRLASAHGWMVTERPATEAEQITFCHRTGVAEFWYGEARMKWWPAAV